MNAFVLVVLLVVAPLFVAWFSRRADRARRTVDAVLAAHKRDWAINDAADMAETADERGRLA